MNEGLLLADSVEVHAGTGVEVFVESEDSLQHRATNLHTQAAETQPPAPGPLQLPAAESALDSGAVWSAAPRFTKVPVDMIGVSGGVVSFVCQATGDPKPRVTWNKKGKRVNSQRIELELTRASQLGKTKGTSYFLLKPGRCPHLRVQPCSICWLSLMLGMCLKESKYFQFQLVKSSTSESYLDKPYLDTIEFDEGAGAVLRIQPLRAPRDENIYECVAENSEGEVSVQAKLTIIRGKCAFWLETSW
ncbi:hypothetical protein NFI96_003085 [Prochilodus magdalenae]|nr:hypothetical protein NFI96_003085 [Prochilodus magdalenae]